jgi:hypothetical protein
MIPGSWRERNMIDFAERALRYRNRAEEVRSIAQDAKQQKARELLERAARDYDEMAAHMERSAEEERQASTTGAPRVSN